MVARQTSNLKATGSSPVLSNIWGEMTEFCGFWCPHVCEDEAGDFCAYLGWWITLACGLQFFPWFSSLTNTLEMINTVYPTMIGTWNTQFGHFLPVGCCFHFTRVSLVKWKFQFPCVVVQILARVVPIHLSHASMSTFNWFWHLPHEIRLIGGQNLIFSLFCSNFA